MNKDVPNLAAPARDVFISYASHDAATASSVVEALERQGIRCWIAPRDVTPGSQYADEIVGAINDAKVLVLVLSQHAVASSHVGREIERAASKRRRIVALRADAAPLTRALEYFLSESQWIDAAALGMPAALAKLAQAVARALSAQSPTNPVLGAGLADSGTPTTIRPVGVKRMALAAVSVIALVVAVTLGVHFWSSKHGDAPAPAITQISDKSIAVLPFADMSQKKDQEYFGDGMAEEILDLLAKIPGLTVIGRTSSFQFKGKNEDLRTIGAKLNAAYVLEGSVRNSGDQVRITAQLINTRTGAHEWSETYDRPFGDVLKLQDAIAAGVVRELQLTVTTGQLNSRSTLTNADAYDLVLRGRYAADRWDPDNLAAAVTLFQQALDRDPTFGDAAAWLAYTYEKIGAYGGPADSLQQARVAATTALRLDSKNSIAHLVLGKIRMLHDWDWVAAERELKEAAALAPGSADPLIGQARLFTVLGRWDDALRQIKAALAVDPLEPNGFETLWLIQDCRGHLPESEAAIRRALDIRPTYILGHVYLGLTLIARGDYNGALVEMQKEPIDAAKQFGLVIAFYALGRKADSDAVLARAVKEDHDAYYDAEIYAFRGQSDDAMRSLESAYAAKSAQLPYLKTDMMLRSLTADARFKAFLRKMNLPE